MLRLWLSFWLVLCAGLATAQDDDDELIPGLVAKYSAGGRSIERVEPDVSQTWDSASPDERLTKGPFDVIWTGQLLMQMEGPHQWHAFVQGQVEIEIDGQAVLKAESATPGWFSGKATDVGLGLKPLKIRFRKNTDRAELHLFWSSNSFRLEPLPAQFLFHEQARRDLDLIERGRLQFAAYRCGRCHVRDDADPALPAPSLKHLKLDKPAQENWAARRLLGQVSGSAMPRMTSSSDEADQVLKLIQQSATAAKLDTLPKLDKKRTDELDQQDGLTLLKTTGCLACHDIQGNREAKPGSGPSLLGVSERHSPEWIYTWLGDPARLNPSHQMPIFRLTDQERRQLVLGLLTLKAASRKEPVETPALGKSNDAQALLKAGRCAACHEIPSAAPVDLKDIPSLKGDINWDKSCLNSKRSSEHQPVYIEADSAAVRAYVDSQRGPLHHVSEAERGRRLLTSKGCLSCHPRGTGSGIAALAKELAAQDVKLVAPTLVPPNLTAVGDKLLDAALIASVSGEQQIRKPWLKVRMPKFNHSDTDKAALRSYFVSHDRIPDGGSDLAGPKLAEATPTGNVSDQELVLGQTLIGPRGLSCIACHQVGAYVPKNVALGTRGSDLLALRSRMRESFFYRWVHAPLRIVPGMEMPSYSTRAAKGILNGDINAQLNLLWRSFNDARFQAPTDPGSVEQYFVVSPNGPARIVRDVFTNPEANGGGTVARAFVVGLGNQHNALFDLDTLTLRAWTYGDLGRQRTVGKSWYWDLAGSSIVSGFSRQSDYFLDLAEPGAGAAFGPKRDQGTVGKLVSYRPYGLGVEFVLDLNFEVAGKTVTVRVTEQSRPVEQAGSQQVGWERKVSVANVPDGYVMLIARPQLAGKATLGKPQITVADSPAAIWKPLSGDDPKTAREVTRMVVRDGHASIQLNYLATLSTHDLPVTLPPPPAPPGIARIESTPGFEGIQLPLPTSIMPTAMTFLSDGTLAFASLKGHVYLAKDTNGDGLEDALTLVEEGLAAPYGIIQDGDSLLVSHKPEVLRLRDTNGDGRADERSVFATGWGFNDNYHDWTHGIVRDSKGNLFVGLGSDYSQPGRPAEVSRWRGKVLKISPAGQITPFAHSLRYPTGLAIDSRDRVFATDNQGEQNCFNELNHLIEGEHYGVPSLHERGKAPAGLPPAIQIPHPKTRSVNGIVFLPESFAVPSLAGHLIGCEYDSKYLVRCTQQEVDGHLQGAEFDFSIPGFEKLEANFQGPLSIAISPRGEIYIGSIHDSGWLGGLNVGSIVKLRTTGQMPNGLRDIKATADGFDLHFFHPVNAAAAAIASNYAISGYQRVWQGTYATADSGRHSVSVTSAKLVDPRRVRLQLDRLKPGFVYEVSVTGLAGREPFFPSTGHYTLHRIPQ